MDLIITNGGSATAIMQAAGIPGVLLPWQDILHAGPVPAGLSLAELTAVRAQFIADCGWGERADIEAGFIERDDTLKAADSYARTRLWFEHDLYDQLQLLQILDWFYAHPPANTVLSLICTDNYLGMQSAEEMLALQSFEAPVNAAQLLTAHIAWSAFRSPSPLAWQALLQQDTAALPFLRGAVLRMLEEYPGCANGLSRTAQTALAIIGRGEERPGKAFAQYQDSEARRFLGDTSFWMILEALRQSDPPLLTTTDDRPLGLPSNSSPSVTITAAGHQVLAGDRHWFDVARLDHWIGGVHLSADNAWCWDSDARALSPYPR